MLQAFEKVHKACPEIDGAALGAGQIGFAHVNAVTVTFYRLAHDGFRGMDSTTIQGLIHNGGHRGLYPKLNAAQTRVDIPFQLTRCLQRTTTQKHQKFYTVMLAACHAKDGDHELTFVTVPPRVVFYFGGSLKYAAELAARCAPPRATGVVMHAVRSQLLHGDASLLYSCSTAVAERTSAWCKPI